MTTQPFKDNAIFFQYVCSGWGSYPRPQRPWQSALVHYWHWTRTNSHLGNIWFLFRYIVLTFLTH